MTVSEAAHVKRDEPVFLHPENVYEGGGDGDGGHAEEMPGQQYLSDQSASGVDVL